MNHPHPERVVRPMSDREPPVSVDWEKYRAVVIESDDWGVGRPGRGMETAAELETLFAFLESRKGCDGQPAVLTAYTCMSNPDYEAIRKNGFTAFADNGPDEIAPEICAKWREGVDRGVYFPEYHSNLHHTSPVVWMDLLRGSGPESEAARERFERGVFFCGRHIPEFQGMNVKEMGQWVRTGIDRFRRAAGYPATVAVTSDAYPETEVIWSVFGIKAVAVKNCRINTGEVVVYPNKPWNNQDPWMPMGAYNRFYDLTYLSRNVFFEFARQGAPDAESVLPVFERCWKGGEPALVSVHRGNFRPEAYGRAGALLDRLAARGDARFLTSAEVVSLYRRGWSLRSRGRDRLLRKWSPEARPVTLDRPAGGVVSLPGGKDCSGATGGRGLEIDIGEGDYLLRD